jgi:hypothetical protein
VLHPNFSEISEALALAGHDCLLLRKVRTFLSSEQTLTMKLSFVLLQVALCLCPLLAVSSDLKECIQPVRTFITEDKCTEPQVPQTICHQKSCVKGHSASDVCTVVTQSILADFAIFDVVFLHEGTCQSEIPSGTFTKDMVAKVLPHNDELVGIQLYGTDILQALEHGVNQSRVNDNREAYPRVAGLRFQVDFDKPYGNRISEAEIMTMGCRWKAVNLKKEYNVLTSRFLAEGGHGYDSLTRTQLRIIGTGHGVTESFWFHVLSTCKILDPFRSPIQGPTAMRLKEKEGLSSRTVTSSI